MELILGPLGGLRSSAALRVLRDILERVRYERMLCLPAYRTHDSYPLQDLAVLLHFLSGRSDALLVASNPKAYHGWFARRHPDTWLLYRLFFLILPVDEKEAAQVISLEEIECLVRSGFLHRDSGCVRALVTVTPFQGCFFISSTFYDPPRDHVFVGADSMILSLYMHRELEGSFHASGLDMCTGSGIQAHTLTEFCGEVIGVDINPRAVEAARTNALLNGRTISFLCSDLFEAVHGRTFNVIASNPPYVMLPENLRDVRYAYGGGDYGMEIPIKIFKCLDNHLRTPGVCFMITFSPVVRGMDVLRERLKDIFSGKDYAVSYWITETFSPDRDVEFYEREGLSAFHMCLVKVEKGKPYSLKVRRPTLGQRLAQWKLPASVSRKKDGSAHA